MRTLTASYTIVFVLFLALDGALDSAPASAEAIPHTPTLEEWRQP